jgi:hypothetical protein
MLGKTSDRKLDTLVRKMLKKANGDPQETIRLAMVGLTSNRALMAEILQAAVIEKFNDILFEAPEKVRGGLLNMVIPV